MSAPLPSCSAEFAFPSASGPSAVGSPSAHVSGPASMEVDEPAGSPGAAARPALAGSVPAAAAVTATHAGEASAATPPALLGVQLVPISGEGSHCWYTAVSRAKNLPGNEIQRLLRQALECIADAETLRRYHFDLAAGATSDEMEAVKAAYLSSQDFLQMQWGGAKEMFLLSHALGGALRFLCVTDAQLPFQRRSAVPLDSPVTVEEIVLLHCAHGDGDGSIKNHWNAFNFQLADGSTSALFCHLRTESEQQQQQREQMLLKVSGIVIQSPAALHKGAPLEDLSAEDASVEDASAGGASAEGVSAEGASAAEDDQSEAQAAGAALPDDDEAAMHSRSPSPSSTAVDSSAGLPGTACSAAGAAATRAAALATVAPSIWSDAAAAAGVGGAAAAAGPASLRAAAVTAPATAAAAAAVVPVVPKQPLPPMRLLQPRSIELIGRRLELSHAVGPNSILLLKDYPCIWHDSSSPTAYLELVSPLQEQAYRIEVQSAESLKTMLKQLYQLLNNRDFTGDLQVVDLSEAAAAAQKPPAGAKQKKRQLEAESRSAAAAATARADDGAASEDEDDEKEYEWTGFKRVDFRTNTVEVYWKQGGWTPEPLHAFREQIGAVHFAFEHHLSTLPPKQRSAMRARMAKGRSAHGTSQPKHKKPKHAEAAASGTAAASSNFTGGTTCCYCGSVAALCVGCEEAGCRQQTCMHCWATALHACAALQPADRDVFRCVSHNGRVEISVHATVQQLGLPSDQLQAIGVWTTANNFQSYATQLQHPLLHALPLRPKQSKATSPLPTSAPAAVLLEYHTESGRGNAIFEGAARPAAGARASECEESQAAFLSRLLDPATTKLAVLLTCGYYRQQLPALLAASRETYPDTTFLLFDIPQLFTDHVQAAICSTVRQYLLYPTRSPLHIAAEHFGKQLLQAYRPAFLFRGHLLRVVHHTKDALRPCQCGVTLKCRGLVHKKQGWEAFERFQLYRYSCKKNQCAVEMLLPHV